MTDRNRSRELVDSTSRAIIEQLQVDGRRAYATIGKLAGLSEAATRHRVQKLVDHGVMRIVAIADPKRLGFARQAMVGIAAVGDVESLAAQLAKIEEVDYLVITAGSFDLVAEVVVRNDEHLLQLVNQIRAADGVTHTELFLYLRLSKQAYNWGRAR